MKRKYRDLVGKLFLSEVVEAFIAMIQEELLSISALEKFSQVLLYGTDPLQLTSTEQRIKNAGFRTVAEDSLETFIDLCKRSNPDIIVLHENTGVGAARQLIDTLIQHGVAVEKIPTYLLTDGALATQMSSLLEMGVEDILPAGDNLNILLVKMKKIQARVEEKARERGELVQQQGASGSLDDMNLIDLLQALGPSRRTVKLTVTSEKQKLTLYLNQGVIVHAETGGITGPEAVYASLAWVHGNWKTQTITPETIPEPNTFNSNESILMEGCRRLDEMSRSKV
jgi:DNA-binding response OmpR family regulator